MQSEWTRDRLSRLSFTPPRARGQGESAPIPAAAHETTITIVTPTQTAPGLGLPQLQQRTADPMTSTAQRAMFVQRQ